MSARSDFLAYPLRLAKVGPLIRQFRIVRSQPPPDQAHQSLVIQRTGLAKCSSRSLRVRLGVTRTPNGGWSLIDMGVFANLRSNFGLPGFRPLRSRRGLRGGRCWRGSLRLCADGLESESGNGLPAKTHCAQRMRHSPGITGVPHLGLQQLKGLQAGEQALQRFRPQTIRRALAKSRRSKVSELLVALGDELEERLRKRATHHWPSSKLHLQLLLGLSARQLHRRCCSAQCGHESHLQIVTKPSRSTSRCSPQCPVVPVQSLAVPSWEHVAVLRQHEQPVDNFLAQH
mmetsp:Transcript_84523/g.244128  ORF Transcript_84523/g.244128 Transcript_84523/m.244128 type:complete len:287 (-) Transcript_84523:623-1483(-)